MKHAYDCDFDLTPERKAMYIRLFKIFIKNGVDRCAYCGRMIEELNMTVKDGKNEKKG